MDESKPVRMMVTYRPKAGNEKELFTLLKKHWLVLSKAGLTTEEPAVLYCATSKQTGAPFFVEIFAWKDAKASELAHQSAAVLALWDALGKTLLNGPEPELAVLEPIKD